MGSLSIVLQRDLGRKSATFWDHAFAGRKIKKISGPKLNYRNYSLAPNPSTVLRSRRAQVYLPKPSTVPKRFT
jgi:hypothetical protein